MPIESIIITIITLIIISSAFTFVVLDRRRKVSRKIITADLTQAMSTEGLDIPILDAYAGLKGLAPIALANNNFRPKLILFDNHMEYRVLVRKRAYYSDIASIRSYRSRFYNKLRFTFNNKSNYFTAVFGNEETLQTVLNFLGERGIMPDEKSRL